MSSVIKQWIAHHTTEVTWNNIIAAVKSDIIGQNEVVEMIQRHVLNISTNFETSELSKQLGEGSHKEDETLEKHSRLSVNHQENVIKYSMF